VKVAGLASLFPGYGGLISAGMLALGDLIGIGRETSSDRRRAGYDVTDAVLSSFYKNVLGRPEDEIYGQYGSSDADRQFIESWRDATVGGPTAGGEYDFLPFDYNNAYGQWGRKPEEMLSSLVEHYASIDPSLRPAMGDIDGWADTGVSQQDLAKQWAMDKGYGSMLDEIASSQTDWREDLALKQRFERQDFYNPYGSFNVPDIHRFPSRGGP
jgi:hypothetical protein